LLHQHIIALLAGQRLARAKYRELIDLGLARGRHAKAIWRDFVDDHGVVHDLDAFFQEHTGLPSVAVREDKVTICFATMVKLAMIRCQEKILRPPGQVSPHGRADSVEPGGIAVESAGALVSDHRSCTA